MLPTVYLIQCGQAAAVMVDRAAATDYAARRGGIVHPVDPEDSARIDWLQAGGLAHLVNALLGDWDSDVLCVGGLPDAQGQRPDVRALIDSLRPARPAGGPQAAKNRAG